MLNNSHLDVHKFIMKGKKVIHMTPSAERVNGLMFDLFDWLAFNEALSSISAISWRKQMLYNNFYNYSTLRYVNS
jgi:hypothetical protein